MVRASRVAPSAMAPDLPDAPAVPGGLVVRLLGGFVVVIDGRPVDRAAWRVRKALSLVKLLALAPGRQLPRDQLLDLLWPDLEPAAAVNNLHRTLHAARHALDPAGVAGALPLRRGMLTLGHPGGVRVDLDDFEAAAALARRTRDVADYRAAIGLYTGELLPEDRYEDWAAPRREALRQQYLALLGEAAHLHAAAGEHDAAVELFVLGVAQDPTGEEAHAGLMRAYALAGRRDEALRLYDRFRAALRDELDAEPEPATRELCEAIRARRFPPASARRPPVAAAAAAAARHNLPRPIGGFVGRKAEIARVAGWLTDPDGPRLISLIGSGGAGKTRLAVEAARGVVGAFPGGVWFVELDAVSTLHLVIAAIAAVLAIQLPAQPGLLPALVAGLRDLRCLLVLDNCEQVAEACRDVLIAALADSPVRVLLTSRVPLGLLGEQRFRVPSLGLPADDPGDDWAAIERAEAGQLFIERARLVAPGFAVRADNGRPVADICRRLDGLPLAIELAAVQLGTLSVAQLHEQLTRSFAILRGEGTGLPTRQQTIAATIAWSYRLLGERERALLRRLAVFAGDFALDAVSAVCGDPDPPEEVLRLLRRLIDHSLVVAKEREGAGTRYRLLEAVRHYALEQLTSNAEREALRDRHAAYYRALAEEARPHLAAGEQTRWIGRLEAELGNLRAALAWSLEGAGEGDARRATRGAELASALAPLWWLRGHLVEGRSWLEALLAHGQRLPPAAHARALTACGEIVSNWGDRPKAASYLEASLPLWREAGDRRGLAGALRQLASIRLPQGDLAAARTLLEESLALCRATGDRHGEALAGGLLARAALIAGDYGEAESLGAASLLALRDLRDEANGALVVVTLGTIALYRGDSARAEELFAAGLDLHRRLGSAWGEADALAFLGWSVLFQGDLPRAAALCAESARRCRAIGDRGILAAALTGQGLALLFAGDHEPAGPLLAEALEVWRGQGNAELAGYCLVGLAGVAGMRGQAERAALLLGAAEALRQRVGVPLRPVAEASYARIVDQVRTGIDDDTFADAWARGRGLTEEAATAAAIVTGGLGPGPNLGA